MFERFQAYTKYMIDDRKRMHEVSTLNSVMCEKQVRRRKTGRLSQQPLNRKSSHAVKSRSRISQIPRAVSCTSARLQRVKGFPKATKDRSGRAQCQAKRTGNIEKTIAKAIVGTEEGSKKSAVLRNVWRQKAMVPWRASP